MKIMVEESFGPILGVASVASDEEAIEKINDCTYGLTAGIFTSDRVRESSQGCSLACTNM